MIIIREAKVFGYHPSITTITVLRWHSLAKAHHSNVYFIISHATSRAGIHTRKLIRQTDKCFGGLQMSANDNGANLKLGEIEWSGERAVGGGSEHESWRCETNTIQFQSNVCWIWSHFTKLIVKCLVLVFGCLATWAWACFTRHNTILYHIWTWIIHVDDGEWQVTPSKYYLHLNNDTSQRNIKEKNQLKTTKR